MKPEKIVNIHSHIHLNTDMSARAKDWEQYGCVKECALADCKFWQAPYSDYLGNEGVLRWMKEYPDVIVGMGSVELGQEMGVPDDISRLKDQGFEGMKFEMPSHPYDHDRYMPLYERAEELQMPILFHTGLVAPLQAADVVFRQSADDMRPFRLDRIARSFPQLRLIGSHLGMPQSDEALWLIHTMPNVYWDMCGGGGGKVHRSRLKRALASFPGANMSDPEENLALGWFKKMTFGTDNPLIADWYPAAEEVMDYLQIPDETRELFYWKNAYDIFGVEGLV